ncbi:hypothetical protein Lal_00045160 [Lupinus albus]|nr:hypothetical protein Lal_00045160 [Lupinus albus]
MTRGNIGHLHPINPEIDRTYHRLVRQSRNLPFHSVPDSDSIHVSVHSLQYTDFVHSLQYTDFVQSIALSDSEHSENSVHSENMAQPPTPPSPRERTLRELAAPDFTYDSLCIQYPNEDVPYVLKTGLIHLLPKTTDHPEAYAANIYNNRPNQQQQNYDPSSSRYNPGWRNHPDLKWSDHTQHQPPHAPFQNNNVEHNRPYVPPPLPSEPSLEELVRQMTMQNI